MPSSYDRNFRVTPETPLSAAVINGGTIVFPYPTGETSSSKGWLTTGCVLVDSQGNAYSTGFTVAYGASTITVTNSSLGTLAAGRRFRLQANYYGIGQVALDPVLPVLDASGNITGLAGVAGSNAAPSAVQSLYAYAAQASATIRFLPPAYGQPTSYLVTTTPATSTTTITPSTTYGQIDATISGLTNGQAYTFTVTPVNSAGNGTTATSNSVTPTTAPTGLSAITGLTAWYDAQQAPQADGANCTTLLDYSGNGWTMTPPTASNRPIMRFAVASLNSLKAYEFQATALGDANNFYAVSALTQAIIGSKCTIFCALSLRSVTGNNAIWSCRDAQVSQGNVEGGFLDTNGGTIRAGGEVNVGLASVAASITTPYVVTYAPGSVSKIYLNGTGGSGSFGYPPFQNATQLLQIGTTTSQNNIFGAFNLHKMLVYSRELTATERQAVETYLCGLLGVSAGGGA